MLKTEPDEATYTEALGALRGLRARADEAGLTAVERRALDLVLARFLPRAAFMERGMTLVLDHRQDHDDDEKLPPF